MSGISSVSSMLNSKLRMSGLSSGIDTDSMIQQLMKVEQMKVDKAKQDKQLLEWKRDNYRDIINTLRGFQDEFFNVAKPASNMRSASIYQTYIGESSAPTVVTASGGAGVSLLTHTITVDQLAAAASVTSASGVSGGTLSTSDTMDTVATKLGLSRSDFTLTINGKNITAIGTETLSSFVSRVNSSDAGVTMSYSAFTDKFTILSKTTGAAGNVAVSDDGNFAQAAKFFSDGMGGYLASGNLSGGTDAQFDLDGVTDVTRSTNTFTIDGVTYNLLKTSAVPVTVNLKQNTDSIFNSIKAFVDKYNSIIDTIHSELNEKRYRDYPPLTEDQKKEMSEEDIKLWEEKAKSGLLRSDSILNEIETKMRRAIGDAVKSVYGSADSIGTLASIGIKSKSYQDYGKLTIDEAKLKEAIQSNPDKVKDLFMKESSIAYSPDMSSTDRTKRNAENGIVNRLYDILQDTIRTTRNASGKKGTLIEKAGLIGDASEFTCLMYKEIDAKNIQIDNLLDKLYDKEEAYYKKFTAMETYLNQMNSQSAWLSQQLGGGQ